jgi:hypothetical protein
MALVSPAAISNTDEEAQIPPPEKIDDWNRPLGAGGAERLAVTMNQRELIALFRRFGDLNVFNLLCLQAELTQLRSKLSLPTLADCEARFEQPNLQQSVNLDRFLEGDDGSKSAERELVLKLRPVLEQYSKSTYSCCYLILLSIKKTLLYSRFLRSNDWTLPVYGVLNR